jgi:hypothetical protein
MKTVTRFLWLGVIALLASCASQPIALAPVGPRPAAGDRFLPSSGTGQLVVFTETDETEYGEDVPFFPHRDYQLYTADGRRLKRVWNSQSPEDQSPAVVTLQAGNYVVKADAELYGLVSVPVVIKPKRTTRVVLQPGWKPGEAVASSELVTMPDGYPVGWRADLPQDK